MADAVAIKSGSTITGRQFPANLKIIVVGSDHKAAMEQYYCKYLSELGVTNELFAAQGLFYKYYHASLFNKILFKFGASSIYKKINQELLRTVEQDKPDVLFIFKGMEIFPATLRRMKKEGIKLVNYNPDNPFIFSGSGSGNKNVADSIPLFDLHLTYDREIKAALEKMNLKVAWIPFGFDLTDKEVELCAAEPEINRVCFLGGPDKERSDFLNRLAEAKIPVDVYGPNWDRFKVHSSISLFDPVYGLEYWKTLRKYRVQLNLMRPHNRNSHNMRSIELPAVGGIGLFPDTADHREFFENGKEIFLYSDLSDCILLARQLLALKPEEANRIHNAARNRSLQGGYSYKHRTQQFLDSLKNLL